MKMIKILKDKRGSVSVLLMMIITTMIFMIMTFVYAAKIQAVSGVSSELGLLWSESILGEYDLNLQNRYGIFGFYGIPSDISKKIDEYAIDSFKDKKYIDYEKSSCELYNYSLASTENFRKQMIQNGKYITLGVIKPPKCNIKISPKANSPINSKSVLENRPSEGCGHLVGLNLLKDIGKNNSISSLIKKGSNNFFENKYILNYFKYKYDKRKLSKTYFNNEIEYILAGKDNDKSNERWVKLAIIAGRTVVNLAFIETNPKMNAETLAAATAIAPEAIPAAQKAINTAWALAESRNDYYQLINGGKVPWIKTEGSWAISLKSIINKYNKDRGLSSLKSKHHYIKMNNKNGQIYEEYLFAMLYLEDNNTKIRRVMDLIQINMKHCYYGSFLIKNYSSGLDLNFKINGISKRISKEYK